VVLHNLRHTFVTNMRRAGVYYFRIMAITGHKTMSALKQDHTIDHEDLHQAIDQLDTYMGTGAAKNKLPTPSPSKTHTRPRSSGG